MDRRLVACAAALCVLATPAVAAAGGPSGAANSAPQSTRVLPNGMVVDTFRQGDVEVRTIGPAGLSSLPITAKDLGRDGSGAHGSVALDPAASHDLKATIAGASTASGPPPTAVQLLIALGEDPATAERDFGDFDTSPSAAVPSAALATYRAPASMPAVTPAVTVSNTVP